MVTSSNISLGHLKREILCIKVDAQDEFGYCGTSSGDILKVRLSLGHQPSGKWTPIFLCSYTRKLTPRQKIIEGYFAKGVTALQLVRNEKEILIGTGNGLVCRAQQIVESASNDTKKSSRLLEIVRETKLTGAVTSLAVKVSTQDVYIGTNDCLIAKLNLGTCSCQILMTAHAQAITDVVFPKNCSDVFVTSSKNEIRIWALESTESNKIVEKQRIKVPTRTCYSVHCMPDGHSIISGWDDGQIRAFGPESGSLIYHISESHKSNIGNKASEISGVTALSSTNDSCWIISGGVDGRVCVWLASRIKQTLIASMKEHKGLICCIRMHSKNKECISASSDGTSIVWDLERFTRKQIVFASTIFKTIAYGLEECQLLTSGSDNKISFWELYDGSLIKQTKAGEGFHSVETLEVTYKGQYLVSGGSDGLVKLWPYHKSPITAVGKGHGDSITRLRVSSDEKTVISVGKDGAIIGWRLPNNEFTLAVPKIPAIEVEEVKSVIPDSL